MYQGVYNEKTFERRISSMDDVIVLKDVKFAINKGDQKCYLYDTHESERICIFLNKFQNIT